MAVIEVTMMTPALADWRGTRHACTPLHTTMHSLALKNDSLMTISVLTPRGFTRPLSMSHMYCMSSDGTGESGAPGTLSNTSASLLQCPMDTDVLTQVIRLLELTVVPTYFVASPRALYMPLAVPQLAGHAAFSISNIRPPEFRNQVLAGAGSFIASPGYVFSCSFLNGLPPHTLQLRFLQVRVRVSFPAFAVVECSDSVVQCHVLLSRLRSATRCVHESESEKVGEESSNSASARCRTPAIGTRSLSTYSV